MFILTWKTTNFSILYSYFCMDFFHFLYCCSVLWCSYPWRICNLLAIHSKNLSQRLMSTLITLSFDLSICYFFLPFLHFSFHLLLFSFFFFFFMPLLCYHNCRCKNFSRQCFKIIHKLDCNHIRKSVFNLFNNASF